MKTSEGNFVFINGKGEIVIDKAFEYASAFRYGVALVRINGKYGYIDAKGNYILQPTYKDATIFNDGVAWVVTDGGRPVMVDANGESLLLTTCKIASFFNEGVSIMQGYDGKYVGLNKKGDQLFSQRDEVISCGYLSNGLIAVQSKKGWGYINKKNEIVIDYQFDTASDFHKNGLAMVSIDNKYGIIDNKGNYIVNPQYDDLLLDHNSLMYTQGLERGHLDLNGKKLYEVTFNHASLFGKTNYAPVMKDGRWGVINKKGEMVIEPQFDWISPFFQNQAMIKVGEKFGLIDSKGKIVVNPVYTDVSMDYICATVDVIEKGGQKLSIASDYIDMSFIDHELTPLLNEIGKNYMDKPLHKLLNNYSVPLKNIRINSSTLIAQQNITQEVKMKIYLLDAPTHKVSDGWWDMITEINPNGPVQHIRIILECSGETREKSRQIVGKLVSVKDYNTIVNDRQMPVTSYTIDNKISRCLISRDDEGDVIINITAYR